MRGQAVPASGQQSGGRAFRVRGGGLAAVDRRSVDFVPKQRSKERLHATIRYLNANHQNRLIRFRGNGTGEAVLWEPIAASAVDRPTISLALRRAA